MIGLCRIFDFNVRFLARDFKDEHNKSKETPKVIEIEDHSYKVEKNRKVYS